METMIEQAVTAIEVQIDTTNFFDGIGSVDGLDGVDQDATIERYRELLAAGLAARHPGVEVEVIYGTGGLGIRLWGPLGRIEDQDAYDEIEADVEAVSIPLWDGPMFVEEVPVATTLHTTDSSPAMPDDAGEALAATDTWALVLATPSQIARWEDAGYLARRAMAGPYHDGEGVIVVTEEGQIVAF